MLAVSPSRCPRVTPNNFNSFLQMPRVSRTTTAPSSSNSSLVCRTGEPRLSSQCPPHTQKPPMQKIQSCGRRGLLARDLGGFILQGCLDLSSASFFGAKRAGCVLTLYIDEMVSFPFSALIGIRVQKVRSFSNPAFVFCFFSAFFFCLNETALVVCYEKKKANNPSPNNRAEL